MTMETPMNGGCATPDTWYGWQEIQHLFPYSMGAYITMQNGMDIAIAIDFYEQSPIYIYIFVFLCDC